MQIVVTVKCRHKENLNSEIVVRPEGGFGSCALCKEWAVRSELDPATGKVTITANNYHPIFSVEIAKE